MQPYPSTIILRHRKENLKKCSLHGLETRDDFRFYTYPRDPYPNLEGYILLTLDAPPLTREEGDHGLFVVDATWRYAEIMLRQVDDHILRRSIPRNFRTAYPRCQSQCPDPEYGLASVEAIAVAYYIFGREYHSLLEHYHWREEFLSQMESLITAESLITTESFITTEHTERTERGMLEKH